LSRSRVVVTVVTTANCVAVAAAAAGVGSLAACGGGGLSPTSSVGAGDSYDDYAVLSRLHQAAASTVTAAAAPCSSAPAAFRPASYCAGMRPAAATATHHHQTGGQVRAHSQPTQTFSS